jgi:hypothetical protein
MRKVFGGVVRDSETLAEVYCVNIMNESGEITNLLREPFSRKKAYGKEFVIETANSALRMSNESELTQEENDWYLAADTLELQELILTENKS